MDFHGEKRTNEAHASTTDPDARLAKKGKGNVAKLCYTGYILTENRNGLVIDACVTVATGTCEREAAEQMLSETPGGHRKTVGADKNYDTKDFVEKCQKMKVAPHVTRKAKESAFYARATCHVGYEVSQRRRKRIEEVFGWAKTLGCLLRPEPLQGPCWNDRMISRAGTCRDYSAHKKLELPKQGSQAGAWEPAKMLELGNQRKGG